MQESNKVSGSKKENKSGESESFLFSKKGERIVEFVRKTTNLLMVIFISLFAFLPSNLRNEFYHPILNTIFVLIAVSIIIYIYKIISLFFLLRLQIIAVLFLSIISALLIYFGFEHEPGLPKISVEFLLGMVTILATMMAITITVLQTVLQLKRDKYNSHVFDKIINTIIPVNQFLNFYIGAIFLIVVLIILYNNTSSSLLYVLLLSLFFFCLFLTLFVLPQVFLSPKEIEKRVENIIEREIVKLIECINLNQKQETQTHDSKQECEKQCETQIRNLQEIFSIILKNKDRDVISFMFGKFTNEAKEFLNDKQDKNSDDRLKDILRLFEYFTDESFIQKDELTLIEIIKNLKELEKSEPEYESNIQFIITDVRERAKKEGFIYFYKYGSGN